MSDKAACPRCDSYVSVVYYEHRHPHCGWNCNVRYAIRVEDYDGHGKEVALTNLTEKPSPAVIDRVQQAALALGINDPEPRCTVTVDGRAPERMTPWLDPSAETPAPLSQARRRENLRALLHGRPS